MAELNYHHLRYFRAVAREGHLTRAAEKLNVSQSALSSQIRTLEARLGHPLFERQGRKLVLTEAGRIAVDHADAIFAAGDDLVSTLKRSGVARQAVRIGALATLSRNFQIDFVRPLLNRDDIEVVLKSGGQEELLTALGVHALDVVLTNQAAPTDALSPFVTHEVSEQAVSLVGLAGLASAEGDLAGWLSSHPLVIPTKGNSVRTGFDAMIQNLGVRPQIAAEVDDMAMMRLLAREGAGLAVLPPIVVKDELASGLLIELHQLPQIREAFLAITTTRRFAPAILQTLLR